MKNVHNVISKIADVYYDPRSALNYFRLNKATSKSAILIGTPAHYNLGDHLIAANEIEFLKNKCHFENVIEIPTRVFIHNKDKYTNLVSQEVPVFITGGGWMGDVWPEDQKIMEDIIDFFSNNNIFVFPQTIFYRENDSIKITQYNKNFIKVLNKARNITIFCRDLGSYDILHGFESANIHIKLAPDIGLYFRSFKKWQNKLNAIGFCLRKDREKVVDNNVKESLYEYFNKKDVMVEVIDTIYNKKVPLWRRKKILANLKNKFSKYDLVITDRLHGMIFSYIVGTNCIAFNNSTNKVKGVYGLWIGSNSNILFVDTTDSIRDLEKVLSYFNVDHNGKNSLDEKFDEMADYIYAHLDKEK